MFNKIPNTFFDESIDWEQFRTEFKISNDYSPIRKGGAYFYLVTKRDLLFSLHKKNIFGIPPEVISIAEFTGGGLVTPHRDKMDKVALNVYLKTDGARTIFYKEKVPTIENVPKHVLAYSTNIENLEEVGSFVAEPYDAFLLNVNMLHGIQKTSEETRIMISYRWKRHSYEEVLNSLSP